MPTMKNRPAHTKRPFRKLTAIVMMTVYLLIVLSPLAPLAMYSKSVAHAVTGECSGDCNICGCSVESRANQTCCCAKKKQQSKLSNGEISEQQPVSKKRSCCADSKPVAPKKECCATSQPVAPKNDCCAKNKKHPHDENAQELQQKQPPPKNETVLKCGCPCGKSTVFALATGSSDSMPFFYADTLPHPHAAYLSFSHVNRLTSRHAEPPDPPPKLTVVA
ncbi:MAG TPA: hypothetical protein HPP94_00515 [Desulfuromonadales bacterium]|nr:hypothetical protein [Desulfuromonadales bacterium]